jgi:hypothetical protein
MRTLALILAFSVLATLVGAADDRPTKKDPAPVKKEPSPDKKDGPRNLPGTFHPLNVTGPYKDHYHCLISEYGLDPMVVIFHKNLDFSDPLRSLVQKLDTAIDKNPAARLSSFVVFLPDELPEVLGASDKEDDARLKLVEQVDDWGKGLKLKHVVLCLDSKPDVEKYNLRDTDLVTVVLCNKLKVVSVFALPKSDFTEDTVAKIMKAVAEQLGATRK